MEAMKEQLEAQRKELEQQEAAILEQLKPLNESLMETRRAAQDIDNQIAAIDCPLKVGDVVTLSFGYKGKTQDWKVVAIHGRRHAYGDHPFFSWTAMSYLVKKDGTLGEKSNTIYEHELKQRSTKVNGQLWNVKACEAQAG